MKSLLICLLASFLAASTIAQSQPAFQVTVTGSGPQLYFLPGATCAGEVWKETVAHYAEHYTCHVFTLAGYAGVPALAEGDSYLPRMVDSLATYIARHGSGMFVGHSIGGFVGLQLAIKYPQLLTQLVVVDAVPFLSALADSTVTADKVTSNPQAITAYYAAIDSASLARQQLSMASYMCADSSRWSTIAQWGVNSDARTMAYTIHDLMTTDLRQPIAHIRTPTTVLVAWHPDIPYAQETITAMYAQQYRRLPGVVIRTAQRAKHFIMYDDPAWFYQQLDELLHRL